MQFIITSCCTPRCVFVGCNSFNTRNGAGNYSSVRKKTFLTFTGLQQPSMSVLMAKWFPRNERGFLSAFIYCGYPLGAFIASLASGALCDLEFLGGWPLVFYTFGLLGVFVGLLMVFFFFEQPSDDPNITQAELQHIMQNQD
ncbi:unnamed protein product, partial [Larinioides sclopetarius]